MKKKTRTKLVPKIIVSGVVVALGAVGIYLSLVSENTIFNVSANRVINCTHTLASNVETVDGKGNYSFLKPGDTVCLAPGTRDSLNIVNVNGAAGSPITFANKGGTTTIRSNAYALIEIKSSSHLRITGSGDSEDCGNEVAESAQACGIILDGGTNKGIKGYYRTEEIEIDHLEIRNGVGQAVSIHTASDEGATRGQWEQHNTILHHNYLHDNANEGFYIGASKWNTETNNPELRGVDISYNLIKNSGWDGIQVGSTVSGCHIHHNTVLRYGMLNQSDQAAGIMVNPGSSCDVSSNYIEGGTGTGIYVQGYVGGNKVYNNIVIGAGSLGSGAKGNGIRGTKGEPIDIWNNTIINTREEAVVFQVNSGSIRNNLIIGAGGGPFSIDTLNSSFVTNNITNLSLADAKFTSGYHLAAGSPVIDKGYSLAGTVVNADYYGVTRPLGGAFDVGASEYDATGVYPTPIPTPVSSTPTFSPAASPSPTATPTVSTSPSPSPSLRASSTPTSEPTVTPRASKEPDNKESKGNKKPVIKTVFFPRAKVNKNYSVRLTGFDPNSKDEISISISGAPEGLNLSNCKTAVNKRKRRVINCKVSGKPQNKGKYKIVVTMTDSAGSKTEKTLKLNVR